MSGNQLLNNKNRVTIFCSALFGFLLGVFLVQDPFPFGTFYPGPLGPFLFGLLNVPFGISISSNIFLSIVALIIEGIFFTFPFLFHRSRGIAFAAAGIIFLVPTLCLKRIVDYGLCAGFIGDLGLGIIFMPLFYVILVFLVYLLRKLLRSETWYSGFLIGSALSLIHLEDGNFTSILLVVGVIVGFVFLLIEKFKQARPGSS